MISEFFGIVLLCHSLDVAGSTEFARRRTKISIGDDSATFKVMHCESGVVWAMVVELYESDDVEAEVRALHKLVDNRVYYDKMATKYDWLYPLPF